MNESKFKKLQNQFNKNNCDKCLRLKQQMDGFVPSSRILNFYMGTGTDQSNRTIHDVWNFSNSKLEKVHDYIQWLFPTSIKSKYNTSAPVLTVEERKKFSKSDIYKKNVKKSLDMMLRFYGLERKTVSGKNVIRMNSKTFHERSKNWLQPSNHNFQRLSRIIRSLSELGMKDFAKALYHCLTRDIYPMFQNVIGDSMKHWKLSFISGTKHA